MKKLYFLLFVPAAPQHEAAHGEVEQEAEPEEVIANRGFGPKEG